jgi:hypothetical protein
MPSPRLVFVLSLLAFGCSRQPAAPAPSVSAETPSAAGPSGPTDPSTQLHSWIPSGAPGGSAPSAAAPAAPAAPAAAELRGTVRETMNAAGYTYLRMDVAGNDRWVATMHMPLAVGNQVVVQGGSLMQGFHSRTLDRTFDAILFAGSVQVLGANGAPAAPAPAVEAAAAPAPAAPSAPGGALHGVVRETMNSGGYTYVRVESGATSTWVAVPVTSVAVGDVVDVPPGNEMPNFRSRTLNRTFETITFASELRRGGAAPAALPPGHPSLGTPALPPGHPAIGTHAAPNSISH